uniref:CCHC-type domain-containing protein n=1 Tax=Tanacetum cinerariifolium TaxID=118510 RepID=A0A6L2JZ99_TANCI|nr:hypothetical protein [Tanacetum cinerariifolium]
MVYDGCGDLVDDKLNYLEHPIPTLPVPAHAGQQVPPKALAAHVACVKDKRKLLEEGQPISSYVIKMKSYIDNLEHLGHVVSLNLVVSLILVSLRKEYDNFVQNYNMHGMWKTVNELHAMLKLHEQTLPKKDAPALHVIRVGKVQKKNHKNKKPQLAAKGNNQGKGKSKLPYAPKPKIPPPQNKENLAKDSVCHQCSDVGHWKRNCPQYLAELLKNKKLSQGASTSGYPKERMGYSFYYPPENKVLVARNAKFFENSLITQEASGSLKDLEIIQEEDMHPFVNTNLHHDEDDQEINEPKSDINPIPALLDPEYDKWLNAMNVEMHSMKDNEVWDLLDLPLNGKAIGSKWLFKKKTDVNGDSIFASSSAKAKYIVALDTSKEAIWVRKFISGLSVVPTIEEPIKMYCDNSGAVTIANELGITNGAKNYRTKVHYLREVIEFEDVKIEKVHTDDNLANPFTKDLPFPKHSVHTKNIGMLPATVLCKSMFLLVFR